VTEPPLNLGFEEAQAVFESGSQNARIWTEAWARTNLFCPNCSAPRLVQYKNNTPVADFHCGNCAEDYELKSTKSRLGRKVTDGAYATMCRRLVANNNPSLVLLTYDRARMAVTNVLLVPKHFFVLSVIEERRPLALTARRAGWIGCNILLGDIPSAGKIFLVQDGVEAPRDVVLERWRSTLFLKQEAGAARGWLIEVMRCVDFVGREEFSLDEVYQQEGRLIRLYPGNNNIRPKIRQQLQVLRDAGYLEFLGRGRYRRRQTARV
jgi:type II restriction enzyme